MTSGLITMSWTNIDITSLNGVHSEQAVVAHACHGHMYRFSPVSLPETGTKSVGVGGGGRPPALAGTREYEQSDRNR